MTQPFIHLNVRSEFSVTEGIIRINKLVQHAAEKNIPAVAVTDTNNLFAAVKLYQAAYKQGVKPIIGCEMQVDGGDTRKKVFYPALFLCCNREGYCDLMRLVSKAYVERRRHAEPYIERAWLAGHSAHLIVLSGATGGDIGTALLAKDEELAQKHLRFWTDTFRDRFYVELQRIKASREMSYINRALNLASRKGVPVVATNRVCFLHRDDYLTHDIRSCIYHSNTLEDESRPKWHTEEQYFKSEEQMCELFEQWPEALENTAEIAKRCTVNLDLGKVLLPVYPTPGQQTPETHLRELATRGLKQRLRAVDITDEKQNAVYNQRLEQELDVIINMDYASYFLIVADFIRWASDNEVPVGPGRGSGAGSLVAYALFITELDPVRYNLLFERFLNPERISMPDFDIDFCMDKRDRVIEYVMQKYGADRVSQIITFGKMAARAVVRDVGRVFGCPYGMMDQIAKMIPGRLDITLDAALKESPELKERCEKDERIKKVINVSLELEGLVRNISRHAGGVVISPDELTEHTALFCEPNSQSPLTQMDMKDLEKIGLVKFDFLGLRTLTVIEHIAKSLRHQGIDLPDWQNIDLEDEKTYRLLQEGKTAAIFQLESEGIRRWLKELKPDCFDDVVAIVALYRPGPLQSGMVKTYIERKHGADVQYLHPKLQKVLNPTYGVILYQEQVMEIAQVLAGYTLGSADILRRAMGKKLPEEMAKQRTVFVSNAVERGVNESVATEIFNLMEKFAGYGFNKSHSVAYALIAYYVAWLKVHYPAYFMAATMSSDMADTDKMVSLIHECRSMNLKVSVPDVNRSKWEFSVADNKIVYGLGAVRSLGRRAMQIITDEREENGNYQSLEDLCARTVPAVRKNMLEVLIRSGGLDCIGDRASMLYRLSPAYAMAEQNHKHKSANQSGLFGGESMEVISKPESKIDSLPLKELLKMEKEALGLYISDHPMRWYQNETRKMNCRSIAGMKQIGSTGSMKCRVAGIITDIKEKRGPKGRSAVFTLDDSSGRIDLLLGGRIYDDCRDMLVHDEVVIVDVETYYDPHREFRNWRVQNLTRLDEARSGGRLMTIVLDAEHANNDFCTQLHEELSSFTANGCCPVHIRFKCPEASAILILGKKWRITPCNEIIERLQRLQGIEKVDLDY